MADEFAEHGVRFYFVYTREAHPGEHYPHHTSFDQKLRHARDMVKMWQMKRPMLVDDVDGTVHHAYGRLPNMTYVVSGAGTILYRASWTDPRTIRMALVQLVHERQRRRAKQRVTPYYIEWMPQRDNDIMAFMEGLVVVGPQAIRDFIAATRHLNGAAAAKPLEKWWARKEEEG